MMTDKPPRIFYVVVPPTESSTAAWDMLKAKSPRQAATICLNMDGFEHADAVEVFEIGRGKRYARQSTAVPLGKAE